MSVSKAYTKILITWRMRDELAKHFSIMAFFAFIGTSTTLYGQPEYDEIPVYIEIQYVGGGEISSVIRGTELYLPVTDLFDFLKIRNIPDQNLESITGFFINPEATYVISRKENKITYLDKIYNLEPGDLIRTESNLYLKSSYFGKVFGLDCNFNFRSLSVKVNSELELPLIREMRQAEMRKNLSRLQGEVQADTTIGRTYPLFKFGMADWSAVANQEISGKSDARLNLALGAMIAGGETTANLYYNTAAPFSEKQQYYLWRYVNNDFSPVRQVMAGKINAHSISSLYNPVIGVQVTNTPTTYRRSFGSYTLSDKTEPGWIVELYVNNVLVDYVKADASGFFTFQVPLVYGNTIVKLKFYGPWGEERTREQNISIPFNFLPVKTFEYMASAGIVEDSSRSRFSRANFNYGLSNSLTVGGGVEYLSSLAVQPAMPFLNASLRITNNLLLSGEYAFGVRARGTLSYRLPSNMQMDLNYTYYEKDQQAINFNYREERKAALSVPLRIGKLSTYQRFSVYQIVLPYYKYTTGEWLLSGSLFGVSTNLTTYGIFMDNIDPYVYSNLSLALRLPGRFVIMPQVQYAYTTNKLISAKATVEKHLLDHAFLNLSFEHYVAGNMNMAELGFRYDFSFAQTGMSVRQSDRRTTFVQYARGSIINDSKNRYIGTDNRTNVGKGGISVTAFIDLNANGIKDKGEPGAHGLNLHTNAGRVERSDRDSTIRILGLEPYTTCFIELDPNSFDNISWRLPFKTFNVTVDPEILKSIEVPVEVAGEATGSVSIEKDGIRTGQERIVVRFYTRGLSRPAGKTITENDGYFSYFGLAPGTYFARPDTAQLGILGMKSYPDSISFDIKQSMDGDIVSGLDFTLRTLVPETAEVPVTPEAPVAQTGRKDTTYMVIHELTRELETIDKDSYAIQLGAFRLKSNAENYRKRIENIMGRKLEIINEDGFYKIRLSDIPDRAEVDKYIDVLRENGITIVWVISMKAIQNRWRIKAMQDSLAQVTTTVVEKPFMITAPNKAIQIGAFKVEIQAIRLQKEIASEVNKPVVVIEQNGFYKVRIIGFSSDEEMKSFLPSLDLLDLHNTRIIPGKKPVTPEPETVRPEEVEQPVDAPVRYEHIFELPKYVPDSLIQKQEELKDTTTVKKMAPEESLPKISLQVGIYYKHSQARRAQKKISSKLHLDVEIVPQWDYYRVLIRGFHSREETYKYYPELAGIGYPGITLIEE